MKKLVLLIFICFTGFTGIAQHMDTSTAAPEFVDTGRPRHAMPVIRLPVTRRARTDTLRRRIVVRPRIADSTRMMDSLRGTWPLATAFSDTTKTRPADTIIKRQAAVPAVKLPYDSFYARLLNNPFLRSNAKPVYLVINERERQSKDEMFYLLLGLLLFLAFIKLVFSRHFKNIFRLFFQPTFRQKQTREQLLQSSFPSLLLNLFFIFSAAAYVSFLVEYYHLVNTSFWWILLYSTAALMVLYTGKFVFLSFAGWVFDVKEATDTYIFAVYLINKIIGVILIPFTLIIAFSKPHIANISITISILIIFLLFIYRYLVSYGPVRREVKVSVLHFFFYIAAFEIIPLLLIYKTLIIYLNNSV